MQSHSLRFQLQFVLIQCISEVLFLYLSENQLHHEAESQDRNHLYELRFICFLAFLEVWLPNQGQMTQVRLHLLVTLFDLVFHTFCLL